MSGLCYEDRRRLHFLILQACLDDSGKDDYSAAFLVAGYLASVDTFMDLADAWKAALEKSPRLEHIKGSEAFNLRGPFEGWTKQTRDERLLEFVPLIQRHVDQGMAFVVDKDAFELIKELPDDDKVSFSHPHEIAFITSLSALLQIAPASATPVDVVFDCDLVNRKYANRAYRRMLVDPMWESLTQRLAKQEPHFEDDLRFLPLQAADLLAYCIRAHFNPRGYAHITNSPVFTAMRSIRTDIVLMGRDLFQYWRDRQERHVERREMFRAMRW